MASQASSSSDGQSFRSSKLLRDVDGITPKMLTQHLRDLEADGLVTRTDFDEKPRRVECSLSAQGWALRPILVDLRNFAKALRGT